MDILYNICYNGERLFQGCASPRPEQQRSYKTSLNVIMKENP